MTSATNKNRALFLDRDGVIIVNRTNYVRSWSDVDIYPQALTALSRLRDWPGKIMVVTNQSVVGRGLLTLQAAEAINERLVREVSRAGGRIDAVFMCPHAPVENCLCRKPQPGLLTQAAQAMGLNMPQSIMIGDALTDIEAGRAAGVGKVALVRTGLGQQQVQSPAAARLDPFAVFDTLSDALEQLIWQHGGPLP